MQERTSEMWFKNYPLIRSDITPLKWNKSFAIQAGWYKVMVMRYQFIKKNYSLLL